MNQNLGLPLRSFLPTLTSALTTPGSSHAGGAQVGRGDGVTTGGDPEKGFTDPGPWR